jgi:primosomal protein N' (replication factor Y) (superfamily II helicase)
MPVVPTLHVVPLVTTRALSGALDYLAPGDGAPLPVGTMVRAPLGSRVVDGVVVGTGEAESEGLRAVTWSERASIPPDLVDLALWIAAYYGSTPARALTLVLPPRVAPASESWVVALPRDDATPLRAPRAAVLDALSDGPRRLAELREQTGASQPLVRRMATDGQLIVESRPIAPPPGVRDRAPLPTEEQALAIERIDRELAAGNAGALLIHGVTGSGKTEVYLHAIAATLDRALAAIVLVPEIALAPQTAGRISARFGERVAVLHSGLSDGARAAAYARIRSGAADVVVGPRSAALAPVSRLGLVVVDEEHDAAYKQGDDPRYDARRVVLRRARAAGALLLACSATPRPESWHGLERISLRRRVGGPLPQVEVVDLRGDPHYPLSRPLRDGLGALADEGGRAILLLNRRGAAPALHCRACGRGFRCPNCDVSLTLYGDRGLRCHHCGHAERVPSTCPTCGAVDIVRLGAGTERVVEAVTDAVGPGVAVLRLDADASSRRGALEEVLDRFAREPRAVLVGTQMVAKGHDVRGVRLAAALDADQGLQFPDFRSEERTFALLTQLAGRSGRLGDSGRVLIQAFDPEARVVQLAAHHAVEQFVTGELARRELLGYPPFRSLVRVEVAAERPDAPLAALDALADAARPELEGDDLLGPAPLLRLRGRARAQLLVKTSRPGRAGSVLAGLVARQGRSLRRAGAQVVIDVDPQ